MAHNVNHKYKPLFENPTNARYFILMGGRGAGRSVVASQYAAAKLKQDSQYFRCAIMRFVLGDIRNSIYQEIYDRIEELEWQNEVVIKEHTLTFTYENNRINGVGFRKSSGDQKSKMKSLASYTCVIIEEADEVAEEDFMQLDDSLRTIKGDIVVIFMLNAPDKNHWIIKRWFNLVKPPEKDAIGFYKPELKENAKSDTVYIATDYTDNEANMAEATIKNFERYRTTKPEHYWNMIRGYVSEGKRGRIFKDWKTTTNKVYDELPFPEIFGLDFGFSNDPAALIGTKRHNRKGWLREYIYETGLTNSMISKRMTQLGIPKSAIIYADNSEPGSIQALRDDGWNVHPCVKGKDSINAGIDLLLDFEMFYTEESENIAEENQEYMWALDRNKEPTNDPIDDFNHAMDATRYAIYTDEHKPFVGFV